MLGIQVSVASLQIVKLFSPFKITNYQIPKTLEIGMLADNYIDSLEVAVINSSTAFGMRKNHA